MTMLSEIQFTEARNQFSTLYDSVFNSFNPTIVKRKQTEQVALLRVDLLKMVLVGRPEIMAQIQRSFFAHRARFVLQS